MNDIFVPSMKVLTSIKMKGKRFHEILNLKIWKALKYYYELSIS